MSELVIGVFLSFFAGRLVVETGLVLMNFRHAAAASRAGRALPPEVSAALGVDVLHRSVAYTVARSRFRILADWWGAGVTLALLFSGLLPRLEAALVRLGLARAHLFVAFLVVLSVATSLASLPFSLYSSFRLEARFGFNRTTPALWALDRLKGLLVAAALGVPTLYALYGLFAVGGRRWWLWAFALLAALQLAASWLYPTVIAPLFNRFAPLPPGALRERLEAMAQAAGFRSGGLYVMDASRRSGHSNAYFTGLFQPRIVLFDTLVAGMTVDEAAAVLAHEIGHYRAHHVHRRLVAGLLVQLASLWVLSLLTAWPPLFAAFGLSGPSLHGAVALASLCGGAFTFFVTPLESFVSRRHEYEADQYSVVLAQAPSALRSALVKLGGQNLSNPYPHPWYAAWHHSHPSLVERLAAIPVGPLDEPAGDPTCAAAWLTGSRRSVATGGRAAASPPASRSPRGGRGASR